MHMIRGRRLPSLMPVLFLLMLWFSPLAANAANLTGLSLAPPNPTVQVGKNVQLTATGSYEDGTQQVIAQAQQVSASSNHTCAVNTDGTVRCWGNNIVGQLGNGTTINSLTPVTVSGINTAVKVSAGGSAFPIDFNVFGSGGHTCAVLADGTIKCWGFNRYGQLGNGTTTDSSTPVAVSGINNAVDVSAGIFGQTCAVLTDGTVRCWGNDSLTPVTVSGISTAVAVSAGSYFSCALLADGTVRCWGDNKYGQLGDGTTIYSTTPVTVSGISSAVAVSAGYYHTCAVLTDGTARCWGGNDSGQLGNGTYGWSRTPVIVSGINNAVEISAGMLRTCALLADGTMRCWGYNFSGQLGNGTTIDSSIPVVVIGLNTAVKASAVSHHTCAVLTDGTIKCWGDNTYGQLGNGTGIAFSTPVVVSGISTAVAVSASYEHTCTVLADGAVKCSGRNDNGQLGDGTTNKTSIPVAVSGLSNTVAVSAGSRHTCALLADGTIKCWGENGQGQLGTGTYYWSKTPVIVSGINDAVAVSAGGSYSCAVLIDGTIRCWGYNDLGQLGNGTVTSSSIPVAVNDITSAVMVSAGHGSGFGPHTCAVLLDGTLRCWGDNRDGQLGDGTTINSLTPVAVSGINNAVSVSAGSDHTCAVLTGGTVWCWGYNNSGQLGNSIHYRSLTPVIVSDIYNAVAVSAGDDHTCALLADGTVRCWGDGYLGNGTYSFSSWTPVIVSGISNAVAVSAGYAHTCAALADGTARCWGSSYFGQLGNGTASYFSTATPTLGYLPLTWTSGNSTVASVNGTGQVKAIAAGATQITASLAGFSANTTVTVTNSTLPTVTGLWPGAGAPGTFVFVFGSNFVSGQTRVKANTVSALVHVLSPDLLIFILPVGDTTGPVTVTTPNGSATSTGIFGAPPTGLSITGYWPGTSKVGGFVFVFGSGYVVNQTQVTVNNVSAALRQVLDPNLLIFMVPPGASTGVITVTTPNGSVSSGGVLTVAP